MTTAGFSDDAPSQHDAPNRESKFQLAHVKVGKVNSVSKRKVIEKETNARVIIWPWNKNYKSWWGVSGTHTVRGELTNIRRQKVLTHVFRTTPAHSILRCNHRLH
jgi:hypothetical protein